jgi:hypothetical protein
MRPLAASWLVKKPSIASVLSLPACRWLFRPWFASYHFAAIQVSHIRQ